MKHRIQSAQPAQRRVARSPTVVAVHFMIQSVSYLTCPNSTTTLWILPVNRVSSRPMPMPSTTGV
jgi:hypothetical protein